MTLKLVYGRYHGFLWLASGNCLSENCEAPYRIRWICGLNYQGPALRKRRCRTRGLKCEAARCVQGDLHSADYSLSYDRHQEIGTIISKKQHAERYRMIFEVYNGDGRLPRTPVDKLRDDIIPDEHHDIGFK